MKDTDFLLLPQDPLLDNKFPRPLVSRLTLSTSFVKLKGVKPSPNIMLDTYQLVFLDLHSETDQSFIQKASKFRQHKTHILHAN